RICEEFSTDSRFRTITTKNGGVARARNRGIDEAAGELVAFLDADDLWHPEHLSELVHELQKADSQTAAAYSLYRLIDENGKVTGGMPPFACSGRVYERLLFANFIGCGSSMLCRTAVVRELGGFDWHPADEGLGGCEDWDLQLRIARSWR